MVKYYDTWGSAIRCAEAFIIIDNGYATSPSNLSRLTLESVEHADSLNELRLFRKNSLKIPAIGVCKGFSNDYWTVVFDRAKPSEEPNLGRSVTMNKNYSEIGMVHYDFDLLYLSKPKSGCKDLRKLKNK